VRSCSFSRLFTESPPQLHQAFASDDPAPAAFLPHVVKTFNCTCRALTRNNTKLAGLPPRKISSFLQPVKDDQGLKIRGGGGGYSIPCECDRLYIYIGSEAAIRWLWRVLSLGHNAVKSVESQPTFRRNTSPLASRLKSKLSKKLTRRSVCYVLHTGFLFYSSTLKMEAACSPNRRFVFQRDTQCYITEDRNTESYMWWTGCSSEISVQNSIDTPVSIIRLNEPHRNTAVAWDLSETNHIIG
jgi:hypothetical protein